MWRSLLLLYTLYTPIDSIMVRGVAGNNSVAQALSSLDRDALNENAPYPNKTDPAAWLVPVSPSNLTEQTMGNSPKISLAQAFWPSLSTYNNVSSLS